MKSFGNTNKQHNWYLIFTKVKAELKAYEHLNRQGYKTYLPMTQKTSRCYDKNIITAEAFFPRYLFIKLNTETDNWKPISSTIGVACMVRFGEMPAIVPEVLIESLKFAKYQIDLQQTIEQKVQIGDKVTVIDGLFAGHLGVCTNS